TLEGTLRGLDASFELGNEATELVATDHREELGTPEDLLQRELIHALPALRSLPDHAEAIASQMRSGRFVVQTERYGGRDREIVENGPTRPRVAVATAGGALTSATLLVAGSLAADKGVRDVLYILGFGGLTGTAVLLMRTVAQALHAQLTRTDRDPITPYGP